MTQLAPRVGGEDLQSTVKVATHGRVPAQRPGDKCESRPPAAGRCLARVIEGVVSASYEDLETPVTIGSRRG